MTATQELPQLLAPREVADWLGISLSTVYHWSQAGTGPVSFRVGKHLRYRRDDVEQWLETQRQKP